MQTKSGRTPLKIVNNPILVRASGRRDEPRSKNHHEHTSEETHKTPKNNTPHKLLIIIASPLKLNTTQERHSYISTPNSTPTTTILRYPSLTTTKITI